MRTTAVSLCFLFALLVSVYGYLRPEYTWDLLGYVGVVLSFEEHDKQRIHEQTYQLVRRMLPDSAYARLAAGNKYRSEVSQNFESFYQQLPFYRVKPLYVGFVYALSKAGLNVIRASVLVSILSFILSSVIIVLWLHKRVAELTLMVAAPLIIITSNLPYAARLSTPDSLSGGLLLASLYVLLEKKSRVGFSILLGVSILARPDNFILAFLLLLYLTYRASSDIRLDFKYFGSVGLTLMAFAVSIYVLSDHYGWRKLFYHTFVHELYFPTDQSVTLSAADYLVALARGIRDIVYRIPAGSFPFFAALALVLFFSRRLRPGRVNIYAELSSVMLLSEIIHFLLLPHAGALDRFSVAQHAFIGMAFMFNFFPPEMTNPAR